MKDWTDRVNGYGVYLRFLLPLFVAVSSWLIINLIGDIKVELREIKTDAKIAATGMVNHLEHHRQLEIDIVKERSKICERLSSIETFIKKGK